VALAALASVAAATTISGRLAAGGRPWLRALLDATAIALLALAACGQDQRPVLAENEALRKQVSKQETMILTLEDGTKVLQQQIDLLNRELREVKQQAERNDADRKALAVKLDRHAAENRRLQAKQDDISQAFRVAEKGAVSEEMTQPLAAVAKAAEDALSRNGYAVRVSLRTDQRAVYVTERKSMPPASLEQAGFRNQYLISLQVLPGGTRLSVRADFEKLAQGNRVLPAGPDEISEIEHRLISEIGKTLATGKI
jgi:nucleotidyltransferase/DNA polymerase involved in DNA repair